MILLGLALSLRRILRIFTPSSWRAPLAGDTILSAAWVEKILKKAQVISSNERILSAGIENNNYQGYASEVKVIKVVKFSDNKEESMEFILKTSKPSERDDIRRSKRYREAIFYNSSIRKQCMPSPKCYFASGSHYFGEYVLLLENLKSVYDASLITYCFGNQKRNIDKALSIPEQINLLKAIFSVAAFQHLSHWNDPNILQMDWLKGVAWRRGELGHYWTELAHRSKTMWYTRSRSVLTKQDWHSEKLIIMIDAAYENADFSIFLDRCSRTPFSIVHGDFHSQNLFYSVDKEGGYNVFAVDWSEVGVGDPAVDIAQLLISDVSPEIFVPHGLELLRHYYDSLSIEGYSYEDCYDSFSRGGAERWMVFVCLLATLVPAENMKYFHDQLLAFVEAFPPKNNKKQKYVYAITSVY